MKSDIKDIILEHIVAPDDERPELTPKQIQTYERVTSLCSLMERHRIDKDVINIYRTLQKENGNEVSIAQAYHHMDIAKHVVGNLQQINRKFERIALANWQKELMVLAKESNDIRGFNQGMANLIKLFGLDREDPIPLDYSKFQPVRPIFGFFPELFDHNEELQSDDEFQATLKELISPEKYRKKKTDAEYVDFEEKD